MSAGWEVGEQMSGVRDQRSKARKSKKPRALREIEKLFSRRYRRTNCKFSPDSSALEVKKQRFRMTKIGRRRIFAQKWNLV
jgi:hypothetical protein